MRQILPWLRGLVAAWALLLAARPAPAQTLGVRHYTTANGLPQTTVYCLAQDGLGRLWVGTQGGLCSFDGQRFRAYGAPEGLPDLHVQTLAAAPGGPLWIGQKYAGLAALGADGRIRAVRLPGLRLPGRLSSLWVGPSELWVGTRGQGVWRLQLRRGAPGAAPDTLVQHGGAGAAPAPTDSVEWVGQGLGGQVWATTAAGLLLLDAGGGPPRPAPGQARLPPLLRGRLHGVCRLSDSVAWLAARVGLLRVSTGGHADPARWRLRRYGPAQGLPAAAVLRVARDVEGQLWVSTTAGLYRSRAGHHDSLRFQRLRERAAFDADRACDLLPDREGSLWAATDRGISQYLTAGHFAQFTTADGLPANAVTALALPRPDELWVGTERDIARLPLSAAGPRSPAQVLRVPGPARGSHYVLSLCVDRRGGVWVGTLGDGARRYEPATGRWQTFNEQVPGLTRQYVSSIAEDARGRVWLTTHRRGVTVYDPATQVFRTFQSPENGLESNNFWQVYRDRAGRLWLGSDDGGLIRVDTDHDTFRRVDGQGGRFSVGSISEDRRGDLWLAPVGQPLLRYDPRAGRLYTYGLGSGLQSINPYFVQVDSAGRVWVGTHLGVDVLDPRRGTVRSHGQAEGFLGGETDENAVLLDGQGRLWMGSQGGLMLHDAHRAPRPLAPPPAALLGWRVNQRPLPLGAGQSLAARQNNLTFDYLGVSLAQPGGVRYQYRLRGLSDEWAGPEEGTVATFANLAPGAYTFEVRSRVGDGAWGRPATHAFRIAAPWWRTGWAALGYVLLLGLLLWGVRRYTRGQERARAERALERQALGHLQELDRVKTDFFTNISHELRTPLSLILGPAELLAAEAPDAASRQRAGLIGAQARKLLALINQLLELSQLDAGALRLHPAAGDVAELARQTGAAFAGLAQERGLALHLELPPGPVPLVFDSEKLEAVLTNLLANALRFTPAGGQVTLTVADEAPSVAAPVGRVELRVQDTGPGVAPADLPHLFDRFYQAGPPAGADGAASAGARAGTGVGLALVRELVALHGGSVEASSAPGQGACFTVRLPRGVLTPAPTAPATPAGAGATPAEGAAPLLPDEVAEVAAPAEAGVGAAGVGVEAPLVLIIEDHAAMRAFIAETLAPGGYRLALAADGAAGLARARAEVPDLIVSDVMMPGLSGYALVAALRAEAATSHIPLVLLTARSGGEDRLRGLESGAQAYVPKPFRPRELQAQVRSLLQLSQLGRARFQASPTATAATTTTTATAPADVAAELAPSLARHQAAVAALPSLDRAFLEKLEATVLEHLGEETLSLDWLGQELGLSRTQLHRKLKALTGQAPGEYLRQARLRRAWALLEGRVGTVAEVAYQVGYSSPAHFSTAFARHFGHPPSAVEAAVAPVRPA